MTDNVQWWYEKDGQQAGPVAAEALTELIRAGEVRTTARVWRAGMAGWQPVAQIPELASQAAPPAMGPPPLETTPVPPSNASPPQPAQGWAPPPRQPYPTAHAGPAPHGAQPPKPRVGYILLGIFLGTLGIHNFYAGYTGRAIAQLLLTILVGWLVVPVVAVWIWNIVEVIVVTRDARGVPFT